MHAGRHYAAGVEEELVEKNSRGIDFISRFSLNPEATSWNTERTDYIFQMNSQFLIKQ